MGKSIGERLGRPIRDPLLTDPERLVPNTERVTLPPHRRARAHPVRKRDMMSFLACSRNVRYYNVRGIALSEIQTLLRCRTVLGEKLFGHPETYLQWTPAWQELFGPSYLARR